MLVWLRRALADRDAQLDYIAQDSIQNADRVLDEFEKTMPALTWPRGNSLDDSRSLGYTEIDAGRDIPSAVPEKVP